MRGGLSSEHGKNVLVSGYVSGGFGQRTLEIYFAELVLLTFSRGLIVTSGHSSLNSSETRSLFWPLMPASALRATAYGTTRCQRTFGSERTCFGSATPIQSRVSHLDTALGCETDTDVGPILKEEAKASQRDAERG
jgi:hypothetical protein